MKKPKKIICDGIEYRSLKGNSTSGGNSEIFFYNRKDTNDKFAIKFLTQKSETKKIRFDKEIEFLRKYNHENIINIIGFGTIETKTDKKNICNIFKKKIVIPYYIMPKYDYTLKQVIENNRNFDELLNLFKQLVQAIKYCHENDIVHRDIKPENILVNNLKQLVLCDFGIAKFKNSTITKEKDFLGNRKYSSPEQLEKGNANNINLKTDIYSLGLILNEMVTKEVALGSDYKKISDIYPFAYPLNEIVCKCIKYNPKDRITVEEIQNEIEYYENTLVEHKNYFEDSLLSEEPYLEDSLSEFQEKIINQASLDMVTAKYVYSNKNIFDLSTINFNYHCNIHFKIDNYLKCRLFQKILYDKCNYYFDKIYKDGTNDNEKIDVINAREIIDEFENKIIEYRLHNSSDIIDNIRKKYISLYYYQCKEINRSIDGIKKVLNELDNGPLLYIILKIISYKFEHKDLYEMIEINWNLTKSAKIEQDNLYNLIYNDKEIAILEKFKKKFDFTYKVVSGDKYLVLFNIEEYKRFKNTIKNLEYTKNNYVFEGDVLDICRVSREFSNSIELVLWNKFDVLEVISKLIIEIDKTK